MNFIKVKSYEELSAKAASIICAQVVLKPDSILGLATGSSPVGTYKKMAEKCAVAVNGKGGSIRKLEKDDMIAIYQMAR